MSKIKMQNVRLSFPSLFHHSEFNKQSTGKYDATFLIPKENTELVNQIKAAIDGLIKGSLKGAKLPADKICLKDGDESSHQEDHGCYKIKASTKKRPLVINRDRSPITEDDDIIYGGCYVNAIISLWAQDNGFGKRINASLEGVQFSRDGDAFGAGGVSVNEFDDFGDAAPSQQRTAEKPDDEYDF